MNKRLALAVAAVEALLAAVVGLFFSQVILVSLAVSLVICAYLLFVIKKNFAAEQQNNDRVSTLAKGRRNGRIRVPFSLVFVTALAIPSGYSIYHAALNTSPEAVYSVAISFGIGMTFLFSMINLPLSIYHKIREKSIPNPTVTPLISVIVPAYNEELLISRTIESLLESSYPSKEIIIVDDGSTDRTQSIALAYETKNAEKANTGTRVIVAKKENGGKASAINYGLHFATGEIVIIVDADSIIGREALFEMIKHFSDPTVAAVGGNVRVMNRWNLITKCQALEYITGINLLKRAFDYLGVVMIVPGALGAFRKSALVERGSYDTDTLTEDFDATLKVLKSGNTVQASFEALSYTEAPTTLKDLYKQRLRWNRGNLQTMIKHRDIMRNPRLGMLHDFGYPAVLLTMLLSPFLGMMVTGFTILALIDGMWQFVLISFLLFAGIQAAFSAIALVMEENEDWKLLLYSPLFVIGYKQLQDYIIIKSIIDVVFKKNLKWTSVKRSGVIRKQKASSEAA